MEHIYEIIEVAATWIEILAALIICITIAVSLIHIILDLVKKKGSAFNSYKIKVVKSLQIGLDLLIAADIIGTVVVKTTLEGVIVLGILVIIRTFLSWSLSLEAEGHWPWQSSKN
jgi:uncharacterized membrane protein